MIRLTVRAAAIAAAASCLLLVAFAKAQSIAAPPAVAIVGAAHFSPVVANVDKTAAFYHDVLGLELSSHGADPHAAAGPRAWDTQPWLRDFHGLPNTRLRYIVADIPGERWGVEMIEFEGHGRGPAIHVQDPGAFTLILLVRDIDRAFARAKNGGAAVVSAGGAPVALDATGRHDRAVLLRDPDDHFVELLQLDPAPQSTASDGSSIIGARVRLTVADTDAAMRIYRDALGLQPSVGAFTTDRALAALMGTPGARIRVTTDQIPGATQLEFVEFAGVERHPVRTRIQDPGSTRYHLRVNNLESAMTALKHAGGSVISLGGTPTIMYGVPYVLIRETNNLYLNLTAGRPVTTAAPSSAVK
jgi:catechol 2,3-dioxygenase-like lactoylglutathione lyase family enzyme